MLNIQFDFQIYNYNALMKTNYLFNWTLLYMQILSRLIPITVNSFPFCHQIAFIGEGAEVDRLSQTFGFSPSEITQLAQQ